MSTDGAVPGPWTRAAAVVAVMAVTGGLARMLVSGWRARTRTGLFVDPLCMASGTCTGADVVAERADAWQTVVPGAVLAAAGLGLAVVVAGVTLLRRPGAVVAPRPARRRRVPRPDRPTWSRLTVIAATVTLCVGILTALPALLALLLGAQLAAAVAGCGAAALVLVLVLAGRLHAPLPDAVLAAVLGSCVAVGSVVACVRVTDGGRLSFGVLVVLLLLVPPPAAGLVTTLTLRVLVRLRRRLVRRRARSTTKPPTLRVRGFPMS